MRGPLPGILFALLAFALFSTHDVVVKTLGGTYAPFQVIFFSVLFSFPITTVVLMRDATAGTLLPVHPKWVIARTIAAVLASICAFYAFSVLPLADAYAIMFASPLLITLLAIPVLGERVRLRRGLAIVVGLSGIIVVLQPGQAELTLGHLAALVSAICGAFASVVVRRIGREERSVVLLLYPMVANFLVMGLMLPVVYEPMPVADLGKVALIALLAFCAMSCIILAYRHAEAALIAPMQYSQILWALIFGALLFGEIPSGTTLIGAGIVIASGLYIVFRESRAGVSDNTPVLRSRSRVGTPAALRIGPILRLRGVIR
ncbi:membrane protein [Primorskyibacter flagellatus]|uniref:Membrane protein n=1 Tax=Primorskyibacter flagellatus TaxID=1387277 RepID=A0A917A9D7_9RHOB|nr:DMT family transporter [Primorskyibacter flagellatus]GGE37067.1 membrane protein [Primorskyibacter flagellatus]